MIFLLFLLLIVYLFIYFIQFLLLSFFNMFKKTILKQGFKCKIPNLSFKCCLCRKHTGIWNRAIVFIIIVFILHRKVNLALILYQFVRLCVVMLFVNL